MLDFGGLIVIFSIGVVAYTFLYFQFAIVFTSICKKFKEKKKNKNMVENIEEEKTNTEMPIGKVQLTNNYFAIRKCEYIFTA